MKSTSNTPPSDAANPKAGRLHDEGLTQVQAADAVADSVELSIPKHVRQHPDAPKLTGYVLTEPLGAGAYGLVWRGWQVRTRKEVAVKVFTQRTGLDWIFLQREVERLTRLDRHPHIVTLLDTNLDEEPPFYVMDLIEGGALNRWVNRESPADPLTALRWMEQICDALNYVHAKALIHCDLKPANILVDGRDFVRVVDFGQSRVFTESAASMGTLFYMAPEQAMLSEPGQLVQPDVRWDVYALGATMHALLTGNVPFASPEHVRTLEEAPTLTERLKRYREMIQNAPPLDWKRITGEVPYELRAIVDRCMAKAPGDRYPTIAAVESDLRNLRERRPVTPLAKQKGYRLRKFVQRNPFQVLAAVAAVGLLVAGGASWSLRSRVQRAGAAEILHTFVSDPAKAADTAFSATGGLASYLQPLAAEALQSEAYTERVVGARAGLFVAPAAFWSSTDGNQTWKHGEWLEVARAFEGRSAEEVARWGRGGDLANTLRAKLTSGSAREKYVALCLAGSLVPITNGLADDCGRVMETDPDCGVAAASMWASKQLGRKPAWKASERVVVDEFTGLAFVRIPATEAFRRGADASDPDRWADEIRPDKGVAIAPILVGTTEVTLAAFQPFWEELRRSLPDDDARARMLQNRYSTAPASELSRIALSGVNVQLARTYCEWLNEHSTGKTPKRKYRLPTEDEWEYACRAGNAGRFCFGDDAAYARYFAHCDGSAALYHKVAEHMPNAFGLFDTHGGVWEATDSAYPKELLPPEAAKDRDYRVLKGGSFRNPAVRCRSSQRRWWPVDVLDEQLGIRLVMELDK